MAKLGEIGKTPSYLPLEPYPVKYILGVRTYVDLMTRILDPGRCDTFSPFDTFRNSISTSSTVCETSVNGFIEGACIGEDPRRKVVLNKCTTQKIFFDRFVRGVRMNVGIKAIFYQYIIVEYMKLFMEKMEDNVRGRGGKVERGVS